ncbi:hypothetical protein Godav_000145 [Gossypium davidsonii]|uniref:Reverse transcriptase zinc-binding domain-containing protein n=1 Tax=Gossypium davidsonii TaxID=34287 RepID=A0A7J8TIC8_GOSDV|nr:hypothetical protein [Gossypium davidsonii]
MPLAETEHEDIQVWKGELSGEFFVRSAYKLLQEATLNPTDYLLQTESKNFYRKLWGLQLPPKITMTIWRISWDYIPNFVNLRCRKVITNEECPRYRSWPEESLYVFRDCPITKEIWISLDLFWVMDNTSQSYWEWLTWVFQKGNDAQCQVIAQSIQRKMAEIEGVRDLKTQKTMVRKYVVQEDLPKVVIQFDAAFDKRSFKSATGLVGWDQNGDLLVLKTVIHKKVSSAFAAEAYACLESMKLGIAL